MDATTRTVNAGVNCDQTRELPVKQFYWCGGCDSLHPVTFSGDCRDDSNRFAPDELDQHLGPNGWEEVDEPDWGVAL